MRGESCSEWFEGLDESGSRLAPVKVKIAYAFSSGIRGTQSLPESQQAMYPGIWLQQFPFRLLHKHSVKSKHCL